MLTKTDFMNFLECPIWLWLIKHRPDLLPPDDPVKERTLAMGREVDEFVRQLFPGGVEIKGYHQQAWEETKKAMVGGTGVLIQPTIVAGALSCRADILLGNGDGNWDLNEVKMSTKVKKEHLFDTGFQYACLQEAGISIRRINLIHINKHYVRQGAIDPSQFFTSEDITDEAVKKLPEVKDGVERALHIMRLQEVPDARVINSCPSPKHCNYLEHYCKGIGNAHGVASQIQPAHLLHLLERKILAHEELPERIVSQAGYVPETGFVKIDAEAIKRELAKLKYPLYFFDYETYGPAIPPFDGLKPYQQIPFQYSLMIQESPHAPLVHREFLMRTFENPVRALLSQLKQDIRPEGSVIVWFAPFETTRNEEMAQIESEFSGFLCSLNNRMFDLMVIFKHRNRMYIRSDFKKSASLKVVLPLLCPELSYDSLTIREGVTASASWPMLTGNGMAESEKTKLASNMAAYCKRDTQAMASILGRIYRDIGDA